jgi:hypothetical protein
MAWSATNNRRACELRWRSAPGVWGHRDLVLQLVLGTARHTRAIAGDRNAHELRCKGILVMKNPNEVSSAKPAGHRW